jgi:hypothetical protein
MERVHQVAMFNNEEIRIAESKDKLHRLQARFRGQVRLVGSRKAVKFQHHVRDGFMIKVHGRGDRRTAPCHLVSRPFPSWNRSMLTEICLCHACSCPEILRTETGGQVRTNAPALQVHTANNIDANPKVWSGKQGALYQKHGAINLETQNYPNAINTAHFPSPILRPRERYHHVAVHSFELGLLQH